jgi:hypothetical protein
MRRSRAVEAERRRAIERHVDDGHGVYGETVGYMTVPPAYGQRAVGLRQVAFQVQGGPSVIVRDRGTGIITLGTSGGEYTARRGSLEGLGHARRLADDWVGTPHWRDVTNVKGEAKVLGGSRIEFRTEPTPGRRFAKEAALVGAGAGGYAFGDHLADNLQLEPSFDDLIP